MVQMKNIENGGVHYLREREAGKIRGGSNFCVARKGGM